MFLGPFSAYHVRFFSLISPLFLHLSEIFLHVSTDSIIQCEDIRSVQEIFVHATYVPFHQLPSVGLPGFFRKFLCTRRTYHSTNYQVWGFPVFSGNFRARDVRTISPTTKCGASRFFQEIFVHATYIPAQPTILGLAQARPKLRLAPISCYHTAALPCKRIVNKRL